MCTKACTAFSRIKLCRFNFLSDCVCVSVSILPFQPSSKVKSFYLFTSRYIYTVTRFLRQQRPRISSKYTNSIRHETQSDFSGLTRAIQQVCTTSNSGKYAGVYYAWTYFVRVSIEFLSFFSCFSKHSFAEIGERHIIASSFSIHSTIFSLHYANRLASHHIYDENSRKINNKCDRIKN